jgi:hypothetical protein
LLGDVGRRNRDVRAGARDHYDYVLDKSVRPNSTEIWDWSAGRICTVPVSEVQVVEGEG